VEACDQEDWIGGAVTGGPIEWLATKTADPDPARGRTDQTRLSTSGTTRKWGPSRATSTPTRRYTAPPTTPDEHQQVRPGGRPEFDRPDVVERQGRPEDPEAGSRERAPPEADRADREFRDPPGRREEHPRDDHPHECDRQQRIRGGRERRPDGQQDGNQDEPHPDVAEVGLP